jgi:NAD(P)-dependent dehydrogenase (short-subunit alcohol dehydrogenase family)
MGILQRFSLAGRVALVTGGAGSYFGNNLTVALAEAGATTYIGDIVTEPAEKLAERLRGEGYDVTALQFDLSDEGSILALREEILKRSGRCDILVNGAVLRTMKDRFQSAASTFDASMKANATGLFTITRAFGDEMAKRGTGSIINVGSIHGLIGPDPSLYRGSDMSGWYPDYFFHKGGMINFTRFIGSYYGAQGVRCNCICPGGYNPSAPPSFVKAYSERTFLGRMANETDLMGVIVFLASDASVYISGAIIPVDGGYVAR